MSTTTIALRPAGRHRAPHTPRRVQWFGQRSARDVVEDTFLAVHDAIAAPVTGVGVAVVGVAAMLWALR